MNIASVCPARSERPAGKAFQRTGEVVGGGFGAGEEARTWSRRASRPLGGGKDLLQWLATLSIIVILSGCALGRPPSPISILAPDVHVNADPGWPEVDWSLQIQRPVADQMRDSDQLLVRRSASRLQVFTGAAWLDQMPAMLHSTMIRAFEDANRFNGVGRAGSFRTRYILATEVRHFEAVDEGGPDLKVDLVVHANLIHQRASRSVATQTFRREVTSSGKSLDPLVDAFETAMSGLLSDMIDWTLEQGEAAGARWEERFQNERERRRKRDGR